MPKRGAIALAITGLVLVLLLSFKTPDEPVLAESDPAAGSGAPSGAVASPAPSTGATDSGDGSGSSGSSSGGTGSAPATTPTPTMAPSTAYRDGTVDGSTVQTRYGPVQVQATISGGQITDIVTLQLPWDHPRSVELSEYAAGVIRDEALQAQSADVDLVSGATYTSVAYVRSLQSALDQARA
jgi:uncharacterized protein with FMN-binding domain